MLTVTGLSKSYDLAGERRVLAIDDVSLEVPQGTIFTLLGPSGCGKTTTLRAIAGLEVPDSGEIEASGKVVFSSRSRVHVPANARGFGMVFQNYAIWPHMTVFENVAFPLQVPGRRTRYSRRQMGEEVARALDIVALSGFESRPATQLSGGQQQRLALARALVAKPSLLLLDEPLSNLDAKLREKMRFELKRLQQEIGITFVYVTHDQSEALGLSHKIAVMNGGRIVQIGSPRDIYDRPSDNFVAEFVGSTNFITGPVAAVATSPTGYTLQTAQGPLAIATTASLRPGETATISVRPEHIRVSLERPSGPNVWPVTVEGQVFLGFCQDLELRCGGLRLEARAPVSLELGPGQSAYVSIDPERCVLCK